MNNQLAKEAFIKEMLRDIGRFDAGSIPQAYRKLTVNPLGAAALNGVLGAAGAYFFTKPSVRLLQKIKGSLTGMSPAQLAKETAQLEKKIGKFRGRFALAAGLGTALPTLVETYKSTDVAPKTGGLNSWFSWAQGDPGSEAPQQWEQFDTAMTDKYTKEKELPGLGKEGSYTNALSDKPSVPVEHSLNIIYNDKFLTGEEKRNAILPFAHSGEGPTGLVSTQDLTQGAIRAGFGLGAGYIAGKTLGAVFGAPSIVTNTLSATGALAGILKNTGVF